MTISTHVLDAVAGGPAAGMVVRLERLGHDEVFPLGEGTTNADGRSPELTDGLVLEVGTHRLRFETGDWFGEKRIPCFHPVVDIVFEITDPRAHYHVPLLLSPFAYSTYRGS
jgi:5-hydroxyisourate hydrolase